MQSEIGRTALILPEKIDGISKACPPTVFSGLLTEFGR
jgi:hypothetical protein